MAPSEHPQTPPETSETLATTGIQTPPGNETSAETPSRPLPPLPAPPGMDAAKFLRLRGWLDAAIVAVILLFAFLVASFPVANPDFFRQLATGRLLVQGQYHFGVDPFVYSADDDYFVNHSWLFALLMYGFYHLPAVGAAAVVIFKALAIAVLAVVLLSAGRRPGQSLWIPAVCTALAILVVSPRLYLQSACLSFLFLGMTLWLLIAVRQDGKRLWWLLPPLFVLWVNCDQWFFLGPLLMALYLAGELLRLRLSGTSAKPQAACKLGLVFAVSLAACLVNPHHVHAFTLPPEFGLTPASGRIENDPQFRALFLSPLGIDYYKPYFGLSVAGLAYWPLLLLGLASFGLVFKRLPWPRLLVWLGFALMSLYNARTIPFFAIVSAPITALNGLDFAALRWAAPPGLTPGRRNWALGGRSLTLLLGLALAIATVPGWLQGQPREARRLGWGVRIDPSLQAMAQTIHEWRQAGFFDEREPHWFNMHRQVANYLAWFAPGERVFLDRSLPYFRKAAEDYRTIRQGLEQLVRQRSDNGDGATLALKHDWQKVLHERRVRYWIVDNNSNAKANLVARWILFTQNKEWVLCYLKGRIAIFAWRDPREHTAPDPSTGLALDLNEAAFGPKAEPAPPRGPELPTSPRNWWEICWNAWRRPAPPLSLDRDTLLLYDFRFQAVEHPREIYRHSRAWQASVAAGALAGSLPRGPLPNSLLTLSWSCTYHDLFPPGAVQPTRPARESEKPAMNAWTFYVTGQFFKTPSLYLGVRAARRALAVNADDGSAYFHLGQAYQRLRGLPQEQNFQQNFQENLPGTAPRLAAIRRTQMATAFQNFLRLQPEDSRAAQAHESLFEMYKPSPRGLGYIDAAVHHRCQALELRTKAGPPPGQSVTEYNRQLESMSAELTRLEGEEERRLNRYEVNAATKSGLEKVKVALELGLSETALAALEEAADTEIRTSAELLIVKQAASVVLDLGRLDKARELLPDPEGQPVRPDDLDLYVRLAAARGDYAEADRLLANALRHAWQPPPGQLPVPDPANQVAPLIGKVVLAEGPRYLRSLGLPIRLPLPWLTNNAADIFQRPWLVQNPSDFWIRRWHLEAVVNGLIAIEQQAEEHLMRGWLALEAGHCGEARKHFQSVRDITVPGRNWIPEVNRLGAWLNAQAEIPAMQQLGLRHVLHYDLSKHYLNWLEEKPIP